MEHLTTESPEFAALKELLDEDKLEAETVVAKAQDPEHPLHGRFTWDDDAAAHKWRVHEARVLIGKFRIVYEGGEVRTSTRAVLRVPSQDRYIDGDEATANFRDELEGVLKRDCRSLVAKHRRLGLETIESQLKDAWETV